MSTTEANMHLAGVSTVSWVAYAGSHSGTMIATGDETGEAGMDAAEAALIRDRILPAGCKPRRPGVAVSPRNPPADSRPFDVGDPLIYHSPATGDAVPVTFRGISEAGAVVMLNGFQVTVDRLNLSRPVPT